MFTGTCHSSACIYMRISCLWGRTPSETGSPAPLLYADVSRISIGGALRPVGHSAACIPFRSLVHCLRLRVRYQEECCIVALVRSWFHIQNCLMDFDRDLYLRLYRILSGEFHLSSYWFNITLSLINGKIEVLQFS